jgi:hypothetical protein
LTALALRWCPIIKQKAELEISLLLPQCINNIL